VKTTERALHLLLAAAVIVPVAIFAAAATYDRYRVLEDADRRIEQTTQLLDEHTTKVFETLDLVMKQVLLRIDGRDWQTIHQDAQLFEELNSIKNALPQIDGIFLVGPTGRTWMTSRMFPAPAGTDFSDRDYFVAQREKDAGTFISQTYLGKFSKHPIFNVSTRRSTPTGAFDGVVGISISLAYFEEFYATLAEHLDHAAALTRSDGAVLVRYPVIEQQPLRWPSAPFTRSIADQPTGGSFEADSSLDGVPRLFRYKRVNTYPLYVSYGVSKAAALAPWYNDLIIFGLLAGLAASGLSILTWTALSRTRQAARAFDDLKRTADDLRREQEFSTRLIRSSREGIFAFDREMRLTVSNPALAGITALPEANMLGRPVLDLFTFAEGSALAKGLHSTLEGREGTALHVTYSVPETGRGGYIDVHYAPLRSSEGEVVGGIAFVIETTEQRRADEAHRQSQKMEAVGQLTGGIAHDFNNLLMVILGNLDRLQARLGQSEARAVAAIRHAAERGEALTKHMLAFSRRQPLRPAPFDLNEKLREISSFLRQSLPPNIEVTLDLDPGLTLVEMDPEQLEVAIINLATNARDAMPDGGALTLRTRMSAAADHEPETTAPFVSLTVSDTGVGIAPELHQRVFDPFFTTKEIGKGTGLGLSRVYGFARQSGGSVKLESGSGKGTAITLLLPVLVSSERQSRPHLVTQDPDGNRPPLNARILLVEDEPEVAELLVEMLQGLGCTVTWVRNAKDCRSLLQTGTEADLVIADIFMPGMVSGVALAKELSQSHPAFRIVLITGSGQAAKETRAQGFEVLQKPFSRAALEELIRAALHPAGDRPVAALSSTGRKTS